MGTAFAAATPPSLLTLYPDHGVCFTPAEHIGVPLEGMENKFLNSTLSKAKFSLMSDKMPQAEAAS